ncbi:MAG: RNA-binding transcriptional accessory protein [Puniceicoccales bacterium]|nr:RNA-binding transcriptional accessory protein [Puniceicoccales bacterium]
MIETSFATANTPDAVRDASISRPEAAMPPSAAASGPAASGALNAAHVARIAQESGIPVRGVAAVGELLCEGATVPFIARYRKERTGELDEVQITTIRDRLEQLRELDSRRAAILKSLEENKHLTPELRKAVEEADSLTRLEDIYAPFRPKRRTRATIARERGLEPLADFLLANLGATQALVEAEAAKYVSGADQGGSDPAPLGAKAAPTDAPPSATGAAAPKEKDVPDVAAALAGARDIIAERVSDDAAARAAVREIYAREATLSSEVIKGKEEEGAKYKDYFEWSEPLAAAPSHRVLAIRRGEKEGFLFFRITIPEEAALSALGRLYLPAATAAGHASAQVREAVHDSWKRLLSPSLETEARLTSKKRADEQAIKVFASNISELLMAPALGQKVTLALDPGFRTGCKLVVLDAQGKLLEDTVVYPTAGSAAQKEDAGRKVRTLCFSHKVQAIAIGNGTASRETDAFVRELGLPRDQIAVVSVNESGASIYSASEVAREEFPDKDVTVRGAVSIGRRLQDPLAELVKLDPKSIGVGQYQHDVDQPALKRSLDDVVTSCVNRVGVELNTASKQLLSYVSGLNGTIAANIVAHRDANGPFKSRDDLRKVPRLGPKAFEQCAGFLRLRDGAHPLDASAVHPERYALVERMAEDAGVELVALLRDPKARARIDPQKYVSSDVGLPTLLDILRELEKPGRDPRQQFEAFAFRDGVHELGDLKEGMRLPGIVTNVTAFGAFVDIGVHQDGLVHVSQLSDNFVKEPAAVVKVGQKVSVTVLEVDVPRRRVALSMKTNPEKMVRGVREAAGDRSGPAPARRSGPGGGFRSGFAPNDPNAPARVFTSGGSFGGNPFNSAFSTPPPRRK